MFYHASDTPNIKTLIPHISNHNIPLIYFSIKRENVLVYLSNAVQKHCIEVNFAHKGNYQKWGSYGFNKNGILHLDEYYPNATEDTYKGVSGYIYRVDMMKEINELHDIPYAYTSDKPVMINDCEFIADAYEALLQAEQDGKIILNKYEDNSEEKLEWIRNAIIIEYDKASSHAEYQVFLKAKFEFLNN